MHSVRALVARAILTIVIVVSSGPVLSLLHNGHMPIGREYLAYCALPGAYALVAWIAFFIAHKKYGSAPDTSIVRFLAVALVLAVIPLTAALLLDRRAQAISYGPFLFLASFSSLFHFVPSFRAFFYLIIALKSLCAMFLCVCATWMALSAIRAQWVAGPLIRLGTIALFLSCVPAATALTVVRQPLQDNHAGAWVMLGGALVWIVCFLICAAVLGFGCGAPHNEYFAKGLSRRTVSIAIAVLFFIAGAVLLTSMRLAGRQPGPAVPSTTLTVAHSIGEYTSSGTFTGNATLAVLIGGRDRYRHDIEIINAATGMPVAKKRVAPNNVATAVRTKDNCKLFATAQGNVLHSCGEHGTSLLSPHLDVIRETGHTVGLVSPDASIAAATEKNVLTLFVTDTLQSAGRIHIPKAAREQYARYYFCGLSANGIAAHSDRSGTLLVSQQNATFVRTAFCGECRFPMFLTDRLLTTVKDDAICVVGIDGRVMMTDVFSGGYPYVRAVSRDGRRFAVGVIDNVAPFGDEMLGRLIVYDVSTRRALLTANLGAHIPWRTWAALSPDGSILAVGQEQSVQLYRLP